MFDPKAYQRKYREANRDRLIALKRQYYRDNSDKWAEYRSRYRSKPMSAKARLSKKRSSRKYYIFHTDQWRAYKAISKQLHPLNGAQSLDDDADGERMALYNRIPADILDPSEMLMLKEECLAKLT